MLQNVFETVIKGSNTIYLNVPENEYFISCSNVSKESAEGIVRNYFQMKGKAGVPHVKEIEHDSSIHKVEITVEVQRDREGKRHRNYAADAII